jgi:predicted TIM-barrel fold metal-dependent hydrolase
VPRPKFPAIDAHNHLGSLYPGIDSSGGWAARPVSQLIDLMDEVGIAAIVDLDGQSGDALKREVDRYANAYPGRFAIFNGVDYELFKRPDFGTALSRNLREAVAAGARGLKVWKPLGLTVKDPAGKLIPVDDSRLDELWATAGELGVPVMIHVADPVAFFEPMDAHNERYEELCAHPDWHFPSPPYPSFISILEQLANVVTRHPKTNFIGAHVGCYAENLTWVGSLMERCPNFFADISARLGELGRQPYSARKFFLNHADQILFGTDLPPNADVYRLHYRFLETDDEYFPYGAGAGAPSQGRWAIYGLFLPDGVLRKIYFENAKRLLML